MNRMQRYIFWRALQAFGLVLMVLIGIVWLTQALQQLDLITTKGQTFFLFLKITWLVLPKFVAFIAPVAVLIASIYTLNSLNTDSELVIITNTGASPFTILKPLLVLACLVAMIDSSIAHYFSPSAQRQVRAFFTEINSDLISTVIKPGEFASIGEGVTFYVGSRDSNGIFQNVIVHDNRDEEQTLTYLAKVGAITRTTEGTFFVLQNGAIHRRPKERRSLSIIDYSSYAIDLSTFSQKIDNAVFHSKPSENFTPYLTRIDPQNKSFVRSPGKFYAELHYRFASPLYSLAYVMVVFFFLGTAQNTRRERGVAVFGAILTVLSIRGLGVVVQSSAEQVQSLNIIQYFLPLGTIAGAAFLILANVQPIGLQTIGSKLDTLKRSSRKMRSTPSRESS